MSDESGYISTDDGPKLHYQRFGDGPLRLLIPAATLLAEDLRHLADRYTLIFYDSRGRGCSDRDDDQSRVWTNYEIQDVELVRRHFGLETVTLWGWSYWGAVTALYAAQYPSRIEKLIMMCPLSPRSPAPYNASEAMAQKGQSRINPVSAKALREAMQSGRHIKEPEWFCREFQRVIAPRQLGKKDALQSMRSDPCACENEWWHNLQQHNALHFPADTRKYYDWRPSATQVSAPTLVVHGAEDLIPVGSSIDWVNAIPNAQLLTIEEAGHYPHLETPESLFPAVERFLQSGGTIPPN